MKHLGFVSSEGGPLLVADAALARHWESQTDGADYQRACDIFDTNPEVQGGLISIGAASALIWEMEGAGTSDVFLIEPHHLLLLRCWLWNPEDEEAIEKLAQQPITKSFFLGMIEIKSSVLAILWAAESGECIESLDVTESARPTGEMAIDGSGLLVALPEGKWQCLHDEVQTDGGHARRCHLLSAP